MQKSLHCYVAVVIDPGRFDTLRRDLEHYSELPNVFQELSTKQVLI